MTKKIELNPNIKLKVGMKIPNLDIDIKLHTIKTVLPNNFWLDEYGKKREFKNYYIFLKDQPAEVISYLISTNQLNQKQLIY